MTVMLIAVFIPGEALERDNRFGLGVILGEPTGVCFKKWLGSQTAIDGAIAWSFGNNDSLHLHIDYLVRHVSLSKEEKDKVLFYYGIGGRVKTEKKSRVGIRVPLGMNYIFEKAPLDIFLEVGPLLDLVPATEFGLTGGIGIRYYF